MWKPLFSVVFRMKFTRKILSVKTIIIFRGVFRTPSSNYQGVFFAKKVNGFLAIGSSHQRCSIKKVALKNFAKFPGKHLWHSLFLIKLQAWGLELYQERDSGLGVFLWFLPNFKNIFFQKQNTPPGDCFWAVN